ncbi:hypothetical protein [Pseudoalteromonas nigrifaciens]|uniref:hypothetical protein n=1 Tax=Pseudoalteromonas nigrifaciens TaxID=28109 RepID=UPI003FD5DCDB
MSINKLLGALVFVLLIVGFLTNSVAMRVFGDVQGSIAFPLILLVLNAVFAGLLITKIQKCIT